MFSNMAKTAMQLKQLAVDCGVKVGEDVILTDNYRYNNEELDFLEKNIFADDKNVYDEDCENNIIPTIEAWAVWLGCSRQNLIALEKRGEDWKDTIQAFKTIISACQTQLAMRQKIPTILHIFNATNNFGYINSSEFKLVPEAPEEKRSLTCDQLPRLDKFMKNDEAPTEIENI